MAAVNALTTFLASQLRDGKRFRFIYVSGLLVERDQTKTLWFGRDMRRFKVCRSLQHGAANAYRSFLTESVRVRPKMDF
jgi:hypothetical protein